MVAGLAERTPIAEVAGIADNWWQLPDSLVSAFCGEELSFGGRLTVVLVYEGAAIEVQSLA